MNRSFKALGQARKKFKGSRSTSEKVKVDEFDDGIDRYQTKPAAKDELNAQIKESLSIEQKDFTIGLDAEKKRNADILNQVMSPGFDKSSAQKVSQKQNVDTPNRKSLLTEEQSKAQKSKSKQKPVILKSINQNWKAFLQKQSSNANGSHSVSKSVTNNNRTVSASQYVAIDCEFVECENMVEKVARISIVDETGKQLYESYVRPDSKIVDYRTFVSGITYGHIKKAPFWTDVKKKVEKILFNKTVVGHTIHKDLEVIGMSDWAGFKGVIDIAQYRLYQENGKNVSLKRLAEVFLQKNIQAGSHSSLQDARATMQLFVLKKDKILQAIMRKKQQAKKIEKIKNKQQAGQTKKL